MDLPPDLHAAATAQFDHLHQKGVLFYYPTEPEVTDHHGFPFEFRISPSIARKPVLAANAPERRRGGGGPFVDPDPAFVVVRGPGPDHVLELSMHAMMRPHYVLHTRLFEPQTDPLTEDDMAACRAIMDRVTSPMMIYNCGYEGGASQGHKHTQVFVEPDPGFALFPERARHVLDHETLPICVCPSVPFQHFVVHFEPQENRQNGQNGQRQPSLPPNAVLHQTYKRLLARVHAAHAAHRASYPEEAALPPDGEPACSTTAYNVVLTPRWMCLVPRRRGGRNGTGAGSLGMLGLLWLRDERERAHWTELGMTDHLVWMGLPWGERECVK